MAAQEVERAGQRESVDSAEVADQAFGGFPDDRKYLTDVAAVRASDSIGSGDHHSGNELQPDSAVDIELIGNGINHGTDAIPVAVHGFNL